MGSNELVASAERLELVAAIFFWAMLVGKGAVLFARGRRWTVPAWAFVAAPWPLLGGWTGMLLARRGELMAPGPVGGALPPQGPFAGLPGLMTTVAALAMLLGMVVLVLVAPPRRAWTRRGGVAAAMAAMLSWGWCLVLTTIDPDTLAIWPYQVFTVTVPDGFSGRAWIFEDKTAGTPPRWWLGSARYILPPNGVLVTRDIGPMVATPHIFWPSGVTVQTSGGDRVPWADSSDIRAAYRPKHTGNSRTAGHESDRSSLPKVCWSIDAGRAFAGAGHCLELLIGDPEWIARQFVLAERGWTRRDIDMLWWNDRVDRQPGPLDGLVNNAAVAWRHVIGTDVRHTYETTWTPSDAAHGPLRFQLIVTREVESPGRSPSAADCFMTLTVHNAGVTTVDGWESAFSTLYAVRNEDGYAAYTQTVEAEERVPCTPLLPRPAQRARHSVVRRPGARPLAPGDEEVFRFRIVDCFFDPAPTLTWARSLAPPPE